MRRKNPNLKNPYQQTEYTQQQILEVAKCATDPVYFIQKYVKIKTFKGQVPFILRDYQLRILDAFINNRYSVLLAPRQCGKTETACAYLLWLALFNAEKTILITSHKGDHAIEIMGKIQFAYEMLPDWLKIGIQDDNWNKHTAAFENKSRIISTTTTATSGRGLMISQLYCDEIAFVQPHIAYAFWESIQPTLATGGSCIVTSTPNGDINLFANLWRSAESGVSPFKAVRVKWTEVPGRDEKFKEEQIAILGLRKWKQEYECEFLTSEKTLIDQFALTQLELKAKKPKLFINQEYPLYEFINPNLSYIIGIDPSEGTGNDFSVLEVFSFPNLEQVLEVRSDTDLPVTLYNNFKSLVSMLVGKVKNVYFSIENNSVGAAFINLYLADENAPKDAYFISETGKTKYGFNTNGVTRGKSLIRFKQMVEGGLIHFNSPEIFKELKSLVNKNGKYQANTGSTDDSIFATVIVIRIVEELATFDDDAYLKINRSDQINVTKQWEITDSQTKKPDVVESSDDDWDGPMPMLLG
jgi:hypothetical protein